MESDHTIYVRTEAALSTAEWQRWDQLNGAGPFLSSAFLRSLEESGSVGNGSGWIPVYFLAEQHSELIGAAVGYIKTDSYGEYIFDWAWANAARRAGIAYYPKLVFAAPVSPVTGHRILLADGADPDRVTHAIVECALELANAANCSSIHWLFCTAAESLRLASHGFTPRATFQYHWHNRDFKNFDDFLAALTSRKRKKFRKERRRALDAIDELRFIPGGELEPSTLAELDRFYRANVAAHGGFDYLRPGFFELLAERAPDTLLYARATRDGDALGGAIFLESDQGLYGRYWGCQDHVEFLHFEVAYYSGIERCIDKGIPLFEAGAQGTHKLFRGFEPHRTYSAHLIRHSGLARAIAEFCRQEAIEIEAEMAHQASFGPFRKG